MTKRYGQKCNFYFFNPHSPYINVSVTKLCCACFVFINIDTGGKGEVNLSESMLVIRLWPLILSLIVVYATMAEQISIDSISSIYVYIGRNTEVVRILTDPIAGDVAQWVRACCADATIPGSSPLGCRGSRIRGNPGTS